jgi:hypothetical protein
MAFKEIKVASTSPLHGDRRADDLYFSLFWMLVTLGEARGIGHRSLLPRRSPVQPMPMHNLTLGASHGDSGALHPDAVQRLAATSDGASRRRTPFCLSV